MLVLLDVKMEPLNVRKNKKTIECDKVRSHVMLVLYNVTMKLSNVKNKKKNGLTECDKSTIQHDISVLSKVFKVILVIF